MLNEVLEALDEWERAGNKLKKVLVDFRITLSRQTLLNQQLVGTQPMPLQDEGVEKSDSDISREEFEADLKASSEARKKGRGRPPKALLTREQKLQACKSYATGRYTHRQIADSYGCSQKTIEKAWADYRKGKFEDLEEGGFSGRAERDSAPF